jgi:hypothetical protein
VSEPWDKLAASFSVADIEWRILDLAADEGEARVRPQLRFEVVLQRLNQVVGISGWSSRYGAIGEAVVCELVIENICKSALAETTHVNKSTASRDAFVYAAELFGLLPPVNTNEVYWVDYDVEAKAVLFEPEAEPVVRETVLPADAQKSAGQQAIDKLVERLRQEGKGAEVAKLIIAYGGYGQNPEAARELYGKLRALLVSGSS